MLMHIKIQWIRSSILALLTCAMWLESSAIAKDFLVTNLADAGPGSLRAAVANANSLPGRDVIRFKKQLQGTIKLTGGQLEIADHLMLTGPGESRLTVSGNKSSRIFKITSKVDVTIEDLAIANGRNTIQENISILVTRGGAILNDGGNLRLSRVTMSNNITINEVNSQVVGGGAIVNTGFAMLTASDCRFLDNAARGGTSYAFGGAIASVTESVATFTNCVFSGNTSTSGRISYGGAIGNFGGSELTVIDCTFHDNFAFGTDSGEMAFGGAIATRPGTVDGSGSMTSISGSLLIANSAIGAEGGIGYSGADAGGGALYNFNSTLVLESSTLVENDAKGGRGNVNGGNAFGGALYASGTNGNLPRFVQIIECDFDGNVALAGSSGSGFGGKALGGALHNASASILELRHSSISGNRARGGQEGIGGGLYTLGTTTADKRTLRKIVGNSASTSNNNVYGIVGID